MTTVRLAWLQDIAATPLTALESRLEEWEAAELARLALASRRRSYLLSRALLRHLADTEPALAGQSLRFARAASGRLLLAAPAGWHISLSHGPGLVAAALAPLPCGVDIERPRRVAFARVAARYFAPAEQAALATLSPADAERDFFRLWTLKEAAAKALGEGLAHNLARLAFSLAGPAPALLAPAAALPASVAGLQAWQAPVAGAWLAAVAQGAAPPRWHCRQVALADLLPG